MTMAMEMGAGSAKGANLAGRAFWEFGAFVDEVLDAGWLPRPDAGEMPKTASRDCARQSATIEPEEFLRRLYRCQE